MSDELVDYARLSDGELVDVAGHIDREAFPDRAAIVDAELAKRTAAHRVLTAEEIAFDKEIDCYLRWRRIAFWSWVAFIPAVAIVGMPLTMWIRSAIPFFTVGIVCSVVYGVFATRVARFTCPRCMLSFTRIPARPEDGFLALIRRRSRSNPFTSSCVNCGLTHSGQRRL